MWHVYTHKTTEFKELCIKNEWLQIKQLPNVTDRERASTDDGAVTAEEWRIRTPIATNSFFMGLLALF